MPVGDHSNNRTSPARSNSLRNLTDEEIRRLRNLFSALSEDSRIRIVLHLLSAADEITVTDVAEAVGLSVSAVSHQLRELRLMGWAKRRRNGRNVLYSVTDRRIEHVLNAGLGFATRDN